jgi:flavin-dependent dehydrogenase
MQTDYDLVIAGVGPGGCVAALAAQQLGLRTLAVDARGPEALRPQLVLVRPRARAALERLGLPDLTEGRRTSTIRQVENRLRAELAARSAAEDPSARTVDLQWHTAISGLAVHDTHVQVSLQPEGDATPRTITARHLLDATGGRLERLGRPARVPHGPQHWVALAEYPEPPWFESVHGISDRRRRDLYFLFPTWGRRGVIAYFDAPPGGQVDVEDFVRRFDATAERLGLGQPLYPCWAVDVQMRGLKHASADRVVPIGDSVGTVDVLLGAGMSTAIEDGEETVRALAAAQRCADAAREMTLTRAASARLLARHRRVIRQGRWMLIIRHLMLLAWPGGRLPEVDRSTPGVPPLLWPAVRFIYGRRPRAA